MTVAGEATFDESLGSDRDIVRLFLGDTGPDDYDLTDAAIDAMLAIASRDRVVYRFARSLQARYAKIVTSSLGDSSESASDLFQHYKDLADSLQAELDAGVNLSVDASAMHKPSAPIFQRHMQEVIGGDLAIGADVTSIDQTPLTPP